MQLNHTQSESQRPLSGTTARKRKKIYFRFNVNIILYIHFMANIEYELS